MSRAIAEAPVIADHVQRLVSPDARATLTRITESGLAADGRLTLIGLEPIANRLGLRWAVRRDAVYDHVERGLEARLPGDAIFLRVSETDYLIALPSLEKPVAQGFCLRFMRETLRHFLGDSQDAEMAVMEVRHVDGHTIQAGAIDNVSVARFAEMSLETLAAHATTKPTPEPLPAPNPWSPFLSSDGRELHVSCYLQRLINLKTYEDIGYRISRFVIAGSQEGRLSPHHLASMSRSDIEKVDKASIYQGVSLLQEKGHKPLVLGVPMSFTTLNSSRGRIMLAEAFRHARGHVSGGLVGGIYDVEGAPPSSLLAASSLVRPFCLRVFANLHAPTKSGIRGLKNGGMNGIAIHCPDFEGDAEFIGWTKAVVGEAAKVAGAVGLHGIKTDRRAAIAATLGVTHASMWEEA